MNLQNYIQTRFPNRVIHVIASLRSYINGLAACQEKPIRDRFYFVQFIPGYGFHVMSDYEYAQHRVGSVPKDTVVLLMPGTFLLCQINSEPTQASAQCTYYICYEAAPAPPTQQRVTHPMEL